MWCLDFLKMINMIRVGPVFLVLHSLKTLTGKAPAAGYNLFARFGRRGFGCYTPETNMTIEKQPFEDVTPIKNSHFHLDTLVYWRFVFRDGNFCSRITLGVPTFPIKLLHAHLMSDELVQALSNGQQTLGVEVVSSWSKARLTFVEKECW